MRNCLICRDSAGQDYRDHREKVCADQPMDSTIRFRIVSSVVSGLVNPSVDMLYEALRPYGIERIDMAFEASPEWIRAQKCQCDAVHFHWPEQLWNEAPRWPAPIRNLPGMWRLRHATKGIGVRRRARSFAKFIEQAKVGGTRIIWTMHNLEPHEGASDSDRRGYDLLVQAADLIICHSESAADACRARYHPPGRIVATRRGNYDGVYPAPRDRTVVRRELGLADDRPLVCCLGALRGYKGIDLACEAVSRLEGRVQLLVAGRAVQFDVAPIRKQMSRLAGAVLVERELSDQEFSDFAAASDAMLLPYRQITGSGALLAALTLKRGVIASDLPYFREILEKEPDAGVLFDPGDAGALAWSIEDHLTRPAASRFAAARRLADEFTWERMVAPIAEVILGWNGARK
jgi:beta-1,4-mannosyltransferase